MSLLVTGSIAVDTVTTPYGTSEDCLGGSSVYFSMAASFFTQVRLVGAVGGDCPFDLAEVFAGREVDLRGVENRPQSKTFRWKGSYQGAMNEAVTELLQLNVLAEEPPKVPAEYADSEFVFLANTDPALQLQLLEQTKNPKFVAADTMNCWIENRLDELKKLLKRIDCLVLNEGEARLLSGEHNLVTAAKDILKMGPGVVVTKKGESGSIMCDSNEDIFVLPAFPSGNVRDPTGAGDSFAGGMLGYLANKNKTDFISLKRSIAYGTVVASFTIEDFSLRRLQSVTRDDIDQRLEALRKATQF